MNKIGFFPYTPATNMLYGLAAAIDMLHEEGLDNVFARHDRHAEATRRAVKPWGLEILCREPKYYSSTLTARADAGRPQRRRVPRRWRWRHFNISYGASFGPFAGKYFRIGHLGDTNDADADRRPRASTEMALALAGVPHKKGGVQAAMDYLVSRAWRRQEAGGGVITSLERAAVGPGCRVGRSECVTGQLAMR